MEIVCRELLIYRVSVANMTLIQYRIVGRCMKWSSLISKAWLLQIEPLVAKFYICLNGPGRAKMIVTGNLDIQVGGSTENIRVDS